MNKYLNLNLKKVYFLFTMFFIILLIITVNSTPSYATKISGSILNLENKAFNAATVSCIFNDNGTVKNIEAQVSSTGNYALNFKYEGFINLVVSIENIKKLEIPCFVSNNSNYNINMQLPVTRIPYIDFEEIKITSNNTKLISYINDLHAAIFTEKYGDLLHSSFNYSNDTTKFIDELVLSLKKIEQILTKNKKHNINMFPIYISYFNLASNLLIVNKANYINKNIVFDFVSKFPPNTNYLTSRQISWNTLASVLTHNFENEYFTSITNKTQSSRLFLKCDVLFSAMMYYFNYIKDEEKAYNYYYKLEKEFSDTPQFTFAKNIYSPEKKIRVGKISPDFSINSIENSKLIFNKDIFAGKYLLINFWMPNDDSSKKELRFITDASEIFYEAPFEILSIALSPSIQEIIESRKISWQMPWLHAQEPGLFNGMLSKKFEISKAPFNILISPDGTILELGESLSGRRLVPTLKKYIKIDSYMK